MTEFIHDDFLLKTGTARQLYREHVEDLSIIDYHIHLDPRDLADDRVFENITQLWIAGDPCKHRALRIADAPELLPTGDVPLLSWRGSAGASGYDIERASLFRSQGSTNDWITYQIPTAIESVKVVAFFAKEVTDLVLRVSSDGNAFTALKPARNERRLPSPPGGAAGGQRRTMVEYECATSADNRYLKLLWSGPAELDRVEIYHP